MSTNTNRVRASRDGDQFHYLWAARRCLSLLSPQSSLVAITIEGVSPSELPEGAVQAGEELIDIAEYYGSEGVKEATCVRYMQLKHSTLHAMEAWPPSGLEKTLAGFADRYRALLPSLTADELGGKLEFWFVTNRQVSANFLEAIADTVNSAVARHPDELTKLETFTELKGPALGAFCRLLHFEAGQDGYWEQRNLLFQDVAFYLPDADVDAPVQLKELITRKALSEAGANPTITKIDVLRALKTDESRLFPAPCLIETVQNAVPREQEAALVSQVVGAAGRPIIVHATGGVGKSVFATRIALSLPAGSVAVLYDCFGHGQYRSATGYRHRHKDALVQIANELAALALCHPLIPTPHADPPQYVRALLYRLEQAATLLRRQHPDALLCVIIDAADNAQMAAEEIGEARSFARDLLREKLPDGCRLVALCRTHRQHLVDPPPGTLKLELKPFSRSETAAYLRQTFPDAIEVDVDEFHRLSSQNPRVQALALSRHSPLAETLRLLGPNPTSVDSAIAHLLQESIDRLRDNGGLVEKEQIDKICAGLAALRPLIPISILSAMSGVSEAAIRSFAIDLGRPLLVTGDSIQFFDEPAETWFRESFKPDGGGMAAFISMLRPLASHSAYVASALPQLMLEAGQFSELVALALSSKGLPETSPLERRDIELQRLQFAIKASLRSKRYVDAAKLALKAGGETAGDDRRRKLLQNNTDLAAQFIGIDSIQELVSRRTFGAGWIGSHHAYEAALLSERLELIGEARSRLRMAEEWLLNWSRLDPEERKKEAVTDEDIVEIAWAHFNIHGAASCASSLWGWQPKEVSFRVGTILARRFVDHGRYHALDELAFAAGNNLCLTLAITTELRAVHRNPPSAVVERAFRLVSNSRIKLKSNDWDADEVVLRPVIALTEAALSLDLCKCDEAVALLSRYLPQTPPRGIVPRFGSSRISILRAYCLRAALVGQKLELVDLAHPELKKEIERKSQHQESHEAREFKEEIGARLPWHQLWAEVLLRQVMPADIGNRIDVARTAANETMRSSYSDEFHAANEIALIWFEVLHQIGVDASSISIFDQWLAALRRPLFTPTLTALARLGSQAPVTHAAALGYAARAFALVKEEREDAEVKSNGYVDIARSVLTIGPSDASAYFAEAVEVSSKIGEENLARWDSILDLANRAALPTRPTSELAYRFARCAELTYAYVARDKHFAWVDTVTAMAGLCPSSAIAILSRWRDRRFGRPERLLPPVIDSLIARGALDARDALPLLGFRADWDGDHVVGKALQVTTDPEDKKDIASFFYRYLSLYAEDAASWKQVRDVFQSQGLDLLDIDRRIGFFERKSVAIRRKGRDHHIDPTERTKKDRDWDALFSGIDLTQVMDLSQLQRNFRRLEPPFYQEALFAEACRRVPAGQEAGFIRVFGLTPEFDLYDLSHFLEVLPAEWKGRPAIRQALVEMMKGFCRRHCLSITRSRYYGAFSLNKACTQSGVDEAEMIAIILVAIGEVSDLLDASRLFSLSGLLAPVLSPGDALDALSFGLGLFDPILEDKDGDGPWNDALLPPADPRDAIAGYIWAGLAAPVAALRWEAAHAVLACCNLGRERLFAALLNIAGNKAGVPFVDARLPFYLLHAQQWLAIALARAARDAAPFLLPHVQTIINWALNDEPHVVIRMFAARAALQLLHQGAAPDIGALRDQLLAINHSSFPIKRTSSYDRIPADVKPAELDDDDKYFFGIDIAPYWFAPLGECFGLARGRIEALALAVIRKDWGYKKGSRWDEDERSRQKLYGDGRQTYHSHGSYPQIDDLHFYQSYHSMMVVAGRLLATTCVHQEPDEDQDEFSQWLERHDIARKDGRWLFDRRDPVPLDWESWWDDEDSRDWRDSEITDAEFEAQLEAGTSVNIWGHWTTADHDRLQSVHLSSALATREKSDALLRALQTARDPNDYAIPSAGSDHEIDQNGFVLKGWVASRSRDYGLDDRDPWGADVAFPPPQPAGFIVERMQLRTDTDQRVWTDSSDRMAMASQVWGHGEDKDEDSDPRQGTRLQASLVFLTDVLKATGFDLIVKIEVGRRHRYRRYQSQEDDNLGYRPAKTKLFLIRADGRISSL